MSYSIDLRERVIKFVEAGGSKSEAARVFCVCRDTVYGWVKKKEATGTLQDDPPKRGWKKIDPQVLIALVKERPDDTLFQYAKHFSATVTAVCLAFKRLKIIISLCH